MILRDAIDHYVAWRRAHGARFLTSANTLYQFCKSVPEHLRCDAVTESEVRRFLAGTGPLTRWRANKYAALAGFYGMRSAAVMPPCRRCRRRTKSRETRNRRRLTFTPAKNWSACSAPSISAASAPFGSMPTPSAHCC